MPNKFSDQYLKHGSSSYTCVAYFHPYFQPNNINSQYVFNYSDIDKMDGKKNPKNLHVVSILNINKT